MPRQLVVKQNGMPGGTTPAYVTPTALGFMWVPEDHDLIYVKNGNAAACVVTFQVPRTIAGVAASPRSVSIPAGQERIFALERGIYNRPAGGTDENLIYVDFSVQTSVQVAVWAATLP